MLFVHLHTWKTLGAFDVKPITAAESSFVLLVVCACVQITATLMHIHVAIALPKRRSFQVILFLGQFQMIRLQNNHLCKSKQYRMSPGAPLDNTSIA
jgi:hypothetical protein